MLSVPVSIGGGLAYTEMVGTYFAKPIQLENETITTGVTKTHPWWKVEGEWPSDSGNSVLIGRRLAEKLKFHPGDSIDFGNGDTKSPAFSPPAAQRTMQ